MKTFKYIFSIALLTTYTHTNILIIGHRGACGYEPENTISSFQRALDMGVDMIELDVYACATGELVVIHDDEVDRTTNGHGNVIDMTFQELRALIVEGKEHIPTLKQVIDLMNRKIPINIELKGPGTAKPVAQLLKKYLAKGWKPEDFVISSFDHSQVAEFKKLCPDIKTGVLFSWRKMPKNIVHVAEQLKADFIGLDVKAVTHHLMQLAHDAGFELFVWTINDKKTANKMRRLKVDGIFSNYPDRV